MKILKLDSKSKVESPKTLEEFKQMRSILMELMGNPYCDQFMFLSCEEKLKYVDKKIEELEPENDSHAD